MSLGSIIRNWPRPSTATPDAYLGNKAMGTIAKFLLLTVLGVGMGVLGAGGVVLGGIACLFGASATMLTVGTVLACTGTAGFGAGMTGMKIVAQRNAPHIDAYTLQEEQRKQQQKQQSAAAPETAHPKNSKKAAKEFNPEAAVRPLKLNARAQQQQANP